MGLGSASRRVIRGGSRFAPFSNYGVVDVGSITCQAFSAKGPNYATQRALDADEWRFELRSGEFPFEDTGDGVERTEFNGSTEPLSFSTTYRVGFDMLIEPGVASTAEWCVLGQWHQTKDVGDIEYSPPWAQYFYPPSDTLSIRSRYSAQDPMVDAPTTTVHYDQANFPRGVWHHFDYTFRFHHTNGRLIGDLNGTRIIDYTGGLGYNDAVGPYWKFGIYREPADETLVVRYRNIGIR